MAEVNQPTLITYMKDRIHKKNKNLMLALVGPTGSGKSYAGLKLAEDLDPTFTIDRVCFRAKTFMQKINELREKEKETTGLVLYWDEMGVENNSRSFMTISNRVVSYFFQTCRHLNIIVIMTVPLLSFLDSTTRKLIHALVETRSINNKEKLCTVSFKVCQTNSISGKTYMKNVRYVKKGRKHKVKGMKVPLPSKKLVEQYEVKKAAFTHQLNKEIQAILEKQEKRDQPKEKKPLTELQQKIKDLWDSGITKQKDIAMKLNKTPQNISENVQFMRNKGCFLKKMGESPQISSENTHITPNKIDFSVSPK